MPGKRPEFRITQPSALQRAVGVAVHASLAELAGRRSEVSIDEVIATAGRHARAVSDQLGCRVGAWNVAPLVGVGLRMLPPAGWRLLAVEAPAGGGRIDLGWSSQGRVLIDEVKTAGFGRVLEDADLVGQIGRYRAWGAAAHPEQFAGVRVLALAGPLRSRFWPPTGPSRPLPDTPYWFGF